MVYGNPQPAVSQRPAAPLTKSWRSLDIGLSAKRRVTPALSTRNATQTMPCARSVRRIENEKMSNRRFWLDTLSAKALKLGAFFLGLAVPEGLEPPTLALGKPCSIR